MDRRFERGGIRGEHRKEADEMIGRQIGPYRIVSKLGAGGMGSVYLGEHQSIRRKAVIKVLKGDLLDRTDVVQRFFNEALAASAVEHPDIVEVFDVGKTPDGLPYILMEHLKGRTLMEMLKQDGRQPEPVVRAIGIRMARALAAAHAKGIIHRDLKPANVLLVSDRDRPDCARVKILDFGIAKLNEASLAQGVETHTKATMGTPHYMSPEHVEGARNADARSDIYSLGVMLYELLLGRTPFKADSLGALLKAHMVQAPEPPRALDPRISEDLERIVLRTLAKDPADRFQSMEELATALAQAGTHGSIPFVDTQVGTTKLAAQPGPTSPGLPAAVVGPPMASPTTLRSTAAEVSAPVVAPAPPRRGLLRPWMGGLFVLAAAGAWVVGGIVLDGDEVREPAPTAKAVKPEEPRPAPPLLDTAIAAEPLVTAVAPTSPPLRAVILRIESVPADAEVYDVAAGERLGATPYEIEVTAGGAAPRLRLVLPGHEPTDVSLPTERSDTAVVKLRPLRRKKKARTSGPLTAID